MSASSGTKPGRASFSTAGLMSSAMTLGAPIVQQQGNRPADAAGGAGDQRDLACNFLNDDVIRISHGALLSFGLRHEARWVDCLPSPEAGLSHACAGCRGFARSSDLPARRVLR